MSSSGVAKAPQAPRPRGPAGLKGPTRGPPGRSSRRKPLARGPNKLFAGGLENHRYVTDVISTQKRMKDRKSRNRKNRILLKPCTRLYSLKLKYLFKQFWGGAPRGSSLKLSCLTFLRRYPCFGFGSAQNVLP